MAENCSLTIDPRILNATVKFRTPDILEVVCHGALFVIGISLNLLCLYQLLWRKKPHSVSPSQRLAMQRYNLLKIHVSFACLFMLFCYTPLHLIWKTTRSWKAGDVLCRVLKFVDVLIFYASSNVIVVIALDRVAVLYRAYEAPHQSYARVKIMLALAWTIAVATSAPQLHIWRAFEPISGYATCTTIWRIWRWENCYYFQLVEEFIYRGVHLAAVFWVPLSIIIVCYAFILRKLIKHQKKRKAQMDTHLKLVGPEENLAEIENPDSPRGPKKSKVSVVISQKVSHIFTAKKSTCSSNTPKKSRFSKAKTSTLRQSFYIVLAYIICWLPYNAFSLGSSLDSKAVSKLRAYEGFLQAIVLLSGVFNPLLYLLKGHSD